LYIVDGIVDAVMVV